MALPEIGLSPAAKKWFETHFEAPTPVQQEGWPRIAAGEHALLIAPTGSGKTLAAFFYTLDRLAQRPPDEEETPGVRVLYVSPLKALVYDIERNLRAPLAGIARTAEALGLPFRAPRVAIRTGDTSQKERRVQLRDPSEILVTTPESLYLLLSSKAREALRTVDTVIVDEIHALAPTKRGAHLALSLERLAAGVTGDDPTRIGLSATARPLEEIARFLGGDRPVSIVDTSRPPRLDLRISVPVPDMTRPDQVPVPTAPGPSLAEDAPDPEDLDREEHADAPEGDEDWTDDEIAEEEGVAPPRRESGSILAALRERDTPPPVTSLWPTLYPRLLEAIRAHRSSIVFVNSRGLCEKLAQRLNELAEEELVRAHHGSIAHDQRLQIEESLKAGTLRAIVATSSLELGIDMGAVDLVLLVESPGSVSRGLQRIGRAGHSVGETSQGLLFPKHRGDLLEATVVAEGMRRGEVEPIRVPRNPLDVLAQQIVAIASQEAIDVESLYALIQRAANYRELSREILGGVLDMLAGRYPSTDFAELKPRLVWDRERDTLEGRRGAGRLAILSGGTIPDRGLYAVYMGTGGPRIGELDEEMVHETRPGETITLGASTWRVTEITRDRVIVVPAPGEPGKLPFWRGEGPGRPLELGRRLGEFTRELGTRLQAPPTLSEGRADADAWLQAEHGLDEWAARNLLDYVIEQQESTGGLPSDRSITVERFRDELGDWRVCILSPFGARLHAPWALAIEARLGEEAGFEVQALWSDDGIVLRFADAEKTPSLDWLLPDPETVEESVVEQLARSSLFAAQFRENAARALLLPRRRPGARTPLWTQRLRAQNLLAVAQAFPSFPIMLETYRACLQDVFDLPGLREILQGLRSRTIRVDDVETRTASPFARSLVFAYTATYLYQGDVPVAERRAQALSLDRHMLRELLGEEELRDLLDEGVIDALVATLQGRTEAMQARHPDGVEDLLRRLGDLTSEEVAARSAEPASAAAWLEELAAGRRAVAMTIGDETRWIAAEDAALYRDALGSVPPPGLPAAFLEPVEHPFEQLVLRWARHHGPFVTATLAERYALLPTQLEPVLAGLEKDGRLLSGEFHPRGLQREWCDPEVLRRLRRHTLAKLRDEVTPVEGPALGRFLVEWHGLDRPRRGESRLDEVLDQLEGLPVSFAELEGAILPARVANYDPRMLDELGALGQWVWVGRGSLGDRDGRVAFYRRERVGLLFSEPELPDEASELHHRLLELLGERGATFFTELFQASGEREQKPLFDTLWDLVWWGHVTNDTFAPLRALGRKSAPRRRPGRRAPPSASAGRWSRVSTLIAKELDDTTRAHARASALLDRYGVLSRDALAIEDLPQGWSGLYPVLKAMEESGRIRRGHFVDGFSGAQFAYVACVDRLRAVREETQDRHAITLAATDPANPYGALLPWPEPTSDAARPRRAAGARVVLVDGEPVLYTDRNARRVWTFPTAEPARRADGLTRAARALGRGGRSFPRGGLRIEQIDGESAHEAEGATAFVQAGYRRSYKGLELERAFEGPGDARGEDE
ncbi:MAG: DEAD/DEAH box helicase [bacterium]|nr:DEAD/DEAH box helicase [bacterium]